MEHDTTQPRRLILLADDDDIILALLRHMLEPFYDVLVATSGEAALRLAEASPRPIDIALLDIALPGIDGIELAGQLHEMHGVPGMFLSASENDEQVERATRAGAIGYLLKPIDTARLLPALRAALARADDLRALRASESRLVQALQAGRETGLAVGILMERHRTDRETAFRVLRDHARATRRRLNDIAAEIVQSAEAMNALTARFGDVARRPRAAGNE